MMICKTIYIDSCIYINLWANETDLVDGQSIGKIAENFLKKCEQDGVTIFYSGFILKELECILGKAIFESKRELIKNAPNFRKIFLSSEELEEARLIEARLNYSISFFDIIHFILARKVGAILVTRDKKLTLIALEYGVSVSKPEQLLKEN